MKYSKENTSKKGISFIETSSGTVYTIIETTTKCIHLRGGNVTNCAYNLDLAMKYLNNNF